MPVKEFDRQERVEGTERSRRGIPWDHPLPERPDEVEQPASEAAPERPGAPTPRADAEDE